MDKVNNYKVSLEKLLQACEGGESGFENSMEDFHEWVRGFVEATLNEGENIVPTGITYALSAFVWQHIESKAPQDYTEVWGHAMVDLYIRVEEVAEAFEIALDRSFKEHEDFPCTPAYTLNFCNDLEGGEDLPPDPVEESPMAWLDRIEERAEDIVEQWVEEGFSVQANREDKGPYEVLVDNIGNVYSGYDLEEAKKEYFSYVGKSISGYGRAAGEQVTLMQDGEPLKEHFP